MGKFAKWIAGGLGWAFLGPIGGILGFVVGSLLETDIKQIPRNTNRTTTVGDFAISMLVLVSAVMKADGKVMKSELNYVQDYFKKKFGAEAAVEASNTLRDLLKQDIPVNDVCHQIRQRTNYSTRLELLYVLFGI
ncbi:MAG: TerB family tellurite resistance protein, partial [Bacteroidota bacterium]